MNGLRNNTTTRNGFHSELNGHHNGQEVLEIEDLGDSRVGTSCNTSAVNIICFARI